MDTPEIRSIAIDAAEKYYAYLDRNDKGLQEVEVFDITPTESGNVYRLRLSAKLFDIESVFFKLYPQSRLVPTTEIAIIEYNADKNIMLVKPFPLGLPGWSARWNKYDICPAKNLPTNSETRSG